MRDRIIALLLDEPAVVEKQRGRYGSGHSSAILMQRADGTMKVEPLHSIEEAKAASPHSGTFRRGRPIIDPDTEEVIGYEMEEVRAR